MRYAPPVLLLICAAALPAGGAEPSADEVFRSSVWPTLEHFCVRCHGPEKQKSGLRLDSREAALKGGKDGPALVPGNPTKSLMVKLVRHADADREMPPKEKLRDDQIAMLEHWISQGAPWPALPVSAPAATPQPAGEKIGDAWRDPRNPIVKIFGGKRLDLWSLKPITDPAPPKVRDAAWVRNPIDAFVLARMEAAGVKPAPEADLRALARRLYFDLTGLPPTPEEMASFLADHESEAYTHLVDKLLDSPRYGEHWGRMWLDVVRYSDSEGFDWDEFRRQAWRFRDYVIRSMNADKPFNRFVREQLAGDEMVPGLPNDAGEQDDLIATGFLLLGPYDNSATKFGEHLRARSQMMSDLVETTGSAFLGLTMTCCRCHDHKFDPISQVDYYRLRAFFEGVKSDDKLPIDFGQQREEICRYNEGVDRELARQNKIIDDLSQTVIKRLHDENLAKLSGYEKALLRLPRDKVDTQKLAEIVAVESSLNPDRTTIRDALPRDLKAQFMAADKATDVLEAQIRPHVTALIGTEGSANSPPTQVLFQGDFTQAREVVPPGFLSVFDPNPTVIKPSLRATTSGRRTALAEWIVSERNPLTPRVLVNRLWQGHFGEGLQATPNDFGLAGAKPSNPELLDWLAREFMREGWSMKKLHRLIATSATYRQGLGAPESGDSPLFASQAPRQLTAESLRDSMLDVAGRLLSAQGGPPRWPDLPDEVIRASPALIDENLEKTKGWYPWPAGEVAVRTVYLVQKRNVHVPMLELLDLPENSNSCPRRNISTVAPQALTLLNSPFAADMANSFAQRLKREVGGQPVPAQIERGFALALQRPPTPKELAACRRFVEHHSLAEFCRALLNLNEFAYVD